MFHRTFAVDDAAARGDDATLRPQSPVDVLFDFDELFRALAFDDLAEKALLLVLYQKIAVDKSVADGFGEKDARRALARRGHSDQNNVFHNKKIIAQSAEKVNRPRKTCKTARGMV